MPENLPLLAPEMAANIAAVLLILALILATRRYSRRGRTAASLRTAGLAAGVCVAIIAMTVVLW